MVIPLQQSLRTPQVISSAYNKSENNAPLLQDSAHLQEKVKEDLPQPYSIYDSQ